MEFLLCECYKNYEIHQNCDPGFDLDKLLIITITKVFVTVWFSSWGLLLREGSPFKSNPTGGRGYRSVKYDISLVTVV